MSTEANTKSQRPATWKALLLLAFVFLLGAMAGIGGVSWVVLKRFQDAARSPQTASGPADLIFRRLESALNADLDLTAGERQAMHEELAITAQTIKDMRIELAQDARTLVETTLDRMEARLPPEKQARLRATAESRLRPWGLLGEGKDVP